MVIKGIAIHGTDFSGKTGLQNRLATYFYNNDVTPVINCGPLVKSTYLSQASQLISQNWHENKRRINQLLIQAYYIDALEYKNDGWHIQDTYYQRTLAYCLTFELDDLTESLKESSNRLLDFEYNIYLDASFSVRMDRARNRKINSELDLIMLRDRESFERLSDIHKYLVQSAPNIINIDTDRLSEEEVFQCVITKLRGC